MGKGSGLITPRIFISHAWEDKELVRRLEKALSAAGAEVWVDHAGVRGGDNLPKRINDALAWCNTLLLVWSKAAEESHWVELEWTNAISLQKRIIPCPIDKTPLPPILANKAYVDFKNEKSGLNDLLRALQLAPMSGDDEDETASARGRRLQWRETPSPISKPDASLAMPRANKPRVVQSVVLQLRHTPVNPLSGETIQQMLREKNFYDKYKNASGKGIQHHYESVERQGVKLVLDHATGLTWQQGGSEKYFSLKDAEAYIGQLNAKKYDGYNDWRLPTLEEAMSLMECEKKNGDLYIDPVFDKTQWWIWTADRESAGRAWVVYFLNGGCYHVGIDPDSYVRAVRS